jgi:hypothetical protein
MANKQLLQSAGDGTAVPAGFVGEVKSVFPAANVGIGGFTTIDLTSTIELTPGVWLLTAYFGGFGSGTGGNVNFDGYITNAANGIIVATTLGWTSGPLIGLTGAIAISLAITSTTQYKLRYIGATQGGTGCGATILASYTRLQAVRIA